MALLTRRPVQRERHRFTVDDVDRMLEAGILFEDDRVELIDGEVIHMSALGSQHMACVNRLTAVFSRSVGDEAIVSVQNALRLGTHQMPQPDVVLLRHRQDFYRDTAPSAPDALLVVEVSDSSLEYDRSVKLPMYARAGIPESWIANLRDALVEKHTDPDAETGAYRSVVRLGRGDRISPDALPSVVLDVTDILGPA
jgi:Uma2 family endonuclease